uniref:Tify domain-containing protein n=1 Tax=Kalanchoe fedtschenkoi TaxID=63787 RepID=A0A7N0TQA5_KALFE
MSSNDHQGSSSMEQKRSHQELGDSTEQETLPHKKLATVSYKDGSDSAAQKMYVHPMIATNIISNPFSASGQFDHLRRSHHLSRPEEDHHLPVLPAGFGDHSRHGSITAVLGRRQTHGDLHCSNYSSREISAGAWLGSRQTLQTCTMMGDQSSLLSVSISRSSETLLSGDKQEGFRPDATLPDVGSRQPCTKFTLMGQQVEYSGRNRTISSTEIDEDGEGFVSVSQCLHKADHINILTEPKTHNAHFESCASDLDSKMSELPLVSDKVTAGLGQVGFSYKDADTRLTLSSIAYERNAVGFSSPRAAHGKTNEENVPDEYAFGKTSNGVPQMESAYNHNKINSNGWLAEFTSAKSQKGIGSSGLNLGMISKGTELGNLSAFARPDNNCTPADLETGPYYGNFTIINSSDVRGNLVLFNESSPNAPADKRNLMEQIGIGKSSSPLKPIHVPKGSGDSSSTKVMQIARYEKSSNTEKLSPASGSTMSSKAITAKEKPQTSGNHFPVNVKGLLSTGIFDGICVKYVSWDRKKCVRGTIKGAGYLCWCKKCNSTKIVNAFELEMHAGCKSKHPNDHIYFSNGKSIYSVVQELRSTSYDKLPQVVRTITGSPIHETNFSIWKGEEPAQQNLMQRK